MLQCYYIKTWCLGIKTASCGRSVAMDGMDERGLKVEKVAFKSYACMDHKNILWLVLPNEICSITSS